MTLRRFTLIAVLAALVSSTAASQGQAGGGTAITTCGTVVTQNAFLTKNLHCVGQAGVVVGASGITIDLRGFTLRGDRSSDDGIDDTGGYNKVTIKNGVVRNFDEGVTASADRISVSSMLASGNKEDGIFIAGASASVRSTTAAGNSLDGIIVFGSSAKIQSSTASGNAVIGISVSGDSAVIQSSTASGNLDGVEINGASDGIQSSTASGNGSYGIIGSGAGAVSVRSSTASGNGTAGIFFNGNSAELKSNRAEANGFAGGSDSDLVGLGIYVTNYATAPVGTNIARGNDQPAQCDPASLC
jgi:large repetitive protein